MTLRHDEKVRLGTSKVLATRLGFGGAAIANMYKPVSDLEALAAINAVWDSGLRYFDTAPYYGWGLSERRLGAALAGRPRDEFVLATKVGRVLGTDLPRDAEDLFVDPPEQGARFDYGRDGTLRSLEQSLERLGLDRIDVALVHDLDPTVHGERNAFVDYVRAALSEMWPTLADLRSDGTLAAIGFGINDVSTAEHLLSETDPDVLLLASRYTLLENSAALSLLDTCARRSVSVIIGAPFNSGILVDGNAPYDYLAAPEDVRRRVARMAEICRRHETPLAAAALQFTGAHGSVASVIPGMRNENEVQENVALINRKIPAGLWRDLQDAGFICEGAPVPASADNLSGQPNGA